MAKAENEEKQKLNDKNYENLLEENIKLKQIINRIKGCLETKNLKK